MTSQQIAAVIRLSADALEGRLTDPLEVSRALVDLGLSFVPVDKLRPFLDDAAKHRVDSVVDVVEDAKFPK